MKDNQKSMTNATDPLKDMKEPHPWRSIGIGLLIIFSIVLTPLVILDAIGRVQELNKFQTFDKDITTIYQALTVGDTAAKVTGQKKNICNTQYFGIGRRIECGTYLTVSTEASQDVETTNKIILSMVQKTNPAVTFSAAISDSEGGVEGGITFGDTSFCGGGYWYNKDNNRINYILHCSDEASGYLAGYEKQ